MRAQNCFAERDSLLANLTDKNLNETVAQLVKLRTMIPLQMEKTEKGNPNLYILVKAIQYGSNSPNKRLRRLYADLLSELVKQDVFLSEINYNCRIDDGSRANLSPPDYAKHLRFQEAIAVFEPPRMQTEEIDSHEKEIIALKKALEESKAEIARLRTQPQPQPQSRFANFFMDLDRSARAELRTPSVDKSTQTGSPTFADRLRQGP